MWYLGLDPEIEKHTCGKTGETGIKCVVNSMVPMLISQF